jgi:hypothetical protein
MDSGLPLFAQIPLGMAKDHSVPTTPLRHGQIAGGSTLTRRGIAGGSTLTRRGRTTLIPPPPKADKDKYRSTFQQTTIEDLNKDKEEKTPQPVDYKTEHKRGYKKQTFQSTPFSARAPTRMLQGYGLNPGDNSSIPRAG